MPERWSSMCGAASIIAASSVGVNCCKMFCPQGGLGLAHYHKCAILVHKRFPQAKVKLWIKMWITWEVGAMFDPTTLSNNVLYRAFKEDCEVTPMKLQKILYFIASEYGKATSEPLFREPFEAWRYGPVLRSVYSEFSTYRSKPIGSYAKDARGASYMIDEGQNPALATAIDTVWNATRGIDAVRLSRITHNQGSAWHKTWTQNGGGSISDQDVREDLTYKEALALR